MRNSITGVALLGLISTGAFVGQNVPEPLDPVPVVESVSPVPVVPVVVQPVIPVPVKQDNRLAKAIAEITADIRGIRIDLKRINEARQPITIQPIKPVETKPIESGASDVRSSVETLRRMREERFPNSTITTLRDCSGDVVQEIIYTNNLPSPVVYGNEIYTMPTMYQGIPQFQSTFFPTIQMGGQ